MVGVRMNALATLFGRSREHGHKHATRVGDWILAYRVGSEDTRWVGGWVC